VWAWLWVRVNTTAALCTVPASRSHAAVAALVAAWAGLWVREG
jgi:hypothetical protein